MWIMIYLKRALLSLFVKAKNYAVIGYAHYWQLFYSFRNKIKILSYKYKWFLSAFVVFVLLLLNWFFYPQIDNLIFIFFTDPSNLGQLKSLFMTLGAALIGATAIAFSLIMFAMQINVERMPYGLFKRLSSDSMLLSAFIATFALAITTISLSLIPNHAWVTIAIIIALWSTILILCLFLFSFRRALILISPIKQLSILVSDTTKKLAVWSRAADRTIPLFRKKNDSVNQEDPFRSTHDFERNSYFMLNSNWTSEALQSINHCISFSRRYAEQGDHEVAGSALQCILVINARYIESKGKTFFAANGFIDNPYSTDGFINETLEQIRQNVQIGFLRGDEQQIEQSFKAFYGLTHIYMNIDYSSDNAEKYHAHLSSGYLISAVESIIPKIEFIEVLIKGTRLMGDTARLILRHNESTYVTQVTKKLSQIACTGILNKKYMVVTQIAVMEISKLTFELIRSRSENVDFAIENIRGDIDLVASMLLRSPDTLLERVHSRGLAPYYSGVSDDSLLSRLTSLANAICDVNQDDESTQRVIRHIRQWGDGLSQRNKDLFILAIEERSSFTNDMVHWIIHIAKIFITISEANICDPHNRDELRTNAYRLVAILSWVPDDAESLSFVESYQITNNLFEIAQYSRYYNCDRLSSDIYRLLVSWAFKAGRYETGYGVLEDACYGLACLNISFGNPDEYLLGLIEAKLNQDNAPNQEIKNRTAGNIMRSVDSDFRNLYGMDIINNAMEQVNGNKLKQLLTSIAEILEEEL